MGQLKDCLLALFRRGRRLDSSDSTSTLTGVTDKSPAIPQLSRPTRKPKPYAIFSPPSHPFANYETFNHETRQIINTTGVHVFKTTLAEDALLPLEDEGIGRLKAMYEVWVAKNGSLSRDKISGIFALGFVSANSITGTVYCADKATRRMTSKHNVQCLYTGTGVRRECNIANSVGCMGMEIWIKASMPLGQPWIQSMYVPPEQRLNRLCLLAAPNPEYSIYVNTTPGLAELPMLTAKPGSPVFELDSDVYVYICRLLPCASVSHLVRAAAARTKEPPMFEFPRLRRAATITTTTEPHAQSKPHRSSSSCCMQRIMRQDNKLEDAEIHTEICKPHVLKPGKKRSLFVHVLSDFDKKGKPRSGGARLMLPGSIQLGCGDGIHLQDVTPGSEITIKNTGYDRAQFILIDMPGYLDADDARSI
ncbi:hypothetical protein LPJ53_001211 [Coemansia erecta]|uniref:Uncharacterized protein n=1 Tax=Coemansia erecta TaxID=147472 RepID=A0A9W7Y4R6_9FUNG|nr:hypothetical protein LPJ53_001211 [Coemansia erecta]